MSKDLEVIEFRKITLADTYDDHYNDGAAWSRVYEYRLVLDLMQKHYPVTKKSFIHNSSWGWQDVHIRFKDALDAISDNCTHSDLKGSDKAKTAVWDITRKAPKDWLEKFDVVINISTVEEVKFDHMQIFNNLLSQVKVGGLLIITFDLPGLQYEKFENRFGKKMITSANDITGANSKLQNTAYAGLSCGVIAVKKLNSTLQEDSGFFKRLFSR